jgi:hypothetical protein
MIKLIFKTISVILSTAMVFGFLGVNLSAISPNYLVPTLGVNTQCPANHDCAIIDSVDFYKNINKIGITYYNIPNTTTKIGLRNIGGTGCFSHCACGILIRISVETNDDRNKNINGFAHFVQPSDPKLYDDTFGGKRTCDGEDTSTTLLIDNAEGVDKNQTSFNGSQVYKGLTLYPIPTVTKVLLGIERPSPNPNTPQYPNLPNLLDNWQLQPSSDFNSDGNVDVLWRNKADGTLVIWYLNGKGNFLSGTNNPVAGDATIAGVKVDQSSGWNISTIGDINGDGNKDIVWHNSISGDRVIWYLNTQRQIVSGDTLPYPSKEWEIVGSTDTNNDNKDDLIFRHKTAGHIVVWRSNRIINAKGENEYQILGGALLTTFSDYNAKIYGAYQSQLQKGTNQYTIQWYYTDGPAKGQKVEWYMNGLTFKSGTNDTTKSVAGIDYAGVK